jgi:hypothetical protein
MQKELTKESVLRALAVSGLREADHAARLLEEADSEVHSQDMGPSDDLLRTYRIRVDHVRSIQGAHAQRLAEATAEFVRLLERNSGQSGRWLTIKGRGELQFNIFCLESGQFLACLPVASKLDVSPERWEELWGRNA